MKKIIFFLLLAINAFGQDTETYNLIQEKDGTITMVSYSQSLVNFIDLKQKIVRTDEFGNIVWERVLKNLDAQHSEIESGGYMIAGFTLNNNGKITGNPSDYDYWIIRIKPSDMDSILKKAILFPNPAKDYTNLIVNAEIQQGNYWLNIYDMAGKFVERRDIQSEKTHINLKEYPQGVYVCILMCKTNVEPTLKLIKE